MSRRTLLCAVFAAVAVSNAGCCGRVRAFFYRLTHCPPGGCYPAFPYADGPMVPTAPAYAGPAPVFGGGYPVGGPVLAGGPGCASCYSSPVDVGGIPTVPAAPVVGVPVFGGPPIVSGQPAPLGQPMPMTPPGIHSTPQSAEPAAARPMGR